jgi:hypothetical protein
MLIADVCVKHIEEFPNIDEVSGEVVEERVVMIDVPRTYKPHKSELDQWKEVAFKSMYLLSEFQRMGAGTNDNLAPMVDMIQDIVIPEHSEHDKERAGIPNSLTNIT